VPLLVQSIHDTYLLVSIVDNAYPEPSSDIFRIFHEVCMCVCVCVCMRARLPAPRSGLLRVADPSPFPRVLQVIITSLSADAMRTRMLDVDLENVRLLDTIAALRAKEVRLTSPSVWRFMRCRRRSSPPHAFARTRTKTHTRTPCAVYHCLQHPLSVAVVMSELDPP
jgi:hypothetical protein